METSKAIAYTNVVITDPKSKMKGRNSGVRFKNKRYKHKSRDCFCRN